MPLRFKRILETKYLSSQLYVLTHQSKYPENEMNQGSQYEEKSVTTQDLDLSDP